MERVLSRPDVDERATAERRLDDLDAAVARISARDGSAHAVTIAANTPAREYIGDGVYVSIYFGDLKLETDRDGVTHWIVLGPSEYAALVKYARKRKADEPD